MDAVAADEAGDQVGIADAGGVADAGAPVVADQDALLATQGLKR